MDCTPDKHLILAQTGLNFTQGTQESNLQLLFSLRFSYSHSSFKGLKEQMSLNDCSVALKQGLLKGEIKAQKVWTFIDAEEKTSLLRFLSDRLLGAKLFWVTETLRNYVSLVPRRKVPVINKPLNPWDPPSPACSFIIDSLIDSFKAV